jgi:hypothetical protein
MRPLLASPHPSLKSSNVDTVILISASFRRCGRIVQSFMGGGVQSKKQRKAIHRTSGGRTSTVDRRCCMPTILSFPRRQQIVWGQHTDKKTVRQAESKDKYQENARNAQCSYIWGIHPSTRSYRSGSQISRSYDLTSGNSMVRRITALSSMQSRCNFKNKHFLIPEGLSQLASPGIHTGRQYLTGNLWRGL